MDSFHLTYFDNYKINIYKINNHIISFIFLLQTSTTEKKKDKQRRPESTY